MPDYQTHSPLYRLLFPRTVKRQDRNAIFCRLSLWDTTSITWPEVEVKHKQKSEASNSQLSIYKSELFPGWVGHFWIHLNVKKVLCSGLLQTITYTCCNCVPLATGAVRIQNLAHSNGRSIHSLIRFQQENLYVRWLRSMEARFPIWIITSFIKIVNRVTCWSKPKETLVILTGYLIPFISSYDSK